MVNKMAGALIAGVCATVLGIPGLLLGLALAFVFYGRTKD